MTAETDILTIIKETPGVTFDELLRYSLWNGETIDRVLRLLKKQGRIESRILKGTKAKGWKLVQYAN